MAGEDTSKLTEALSSGGGGRMGGMGFGAVQLGMGLLNRKKADAMLPASENAMERQLYNVAKRKRIAIQTGTAGKSDRAALRQTLAQFGQNTFRAGGPVNFGILNQMRAQGEKNISDQYAQQYGEAFKDESALGGKMADVSRDLALLKSARKSAQAEQQVQAGQQNILASMPTREQMASILKALIPGGSAV